MQIVVDGILTNYKKVGNGKIFVVIVHGWKRSLEEWLPLAHSLESNYTCILLDLPGFGASMLPAKSFDTYEYATFVEHFLQKLDITSCIFIGHSLGGRIGIILAATTKYISQLFLIDSAGIEQKNMFTKAKQLVAMILKPSYSFLPSSMRKNIIKAFASDDYNSAGPLKKTFVKIVNQDLTHLLSKISQPTTIIWGENDTALPVQQTKIFKNKIPNSHVRIVWSTGHFPHLEKPSEFFEIVNDELAISN